MAKVNITLKDKGHGAVSLKLSAHPEPTCEEDMSPAHKLAAVIVQAIQAGRLAIPRQETPQAPDMGRLYGNCGQADCPSCMRPALVSQEGQ